MRLLCLWCRRKFVLLLVLITTVSVLWTCWIGSRLQSHRVEIPVEGFQLTTKSRTPGNLKELNSLLINGIFSQEKELTFTKRVLENYPTDSVTRNSNVSHGITDKVLLQRLQEVNTYLMHITCFIAKLDPIACNCSVLQIKYTVGTLDFSSFSSSHISHLLCSNSELN